MSTPETIMAAVVVFVCVAAWRNWTVVALVSSWAIIQTAWLLTKEWSPMLELICDYAVIVAVIVKPGLECTAYRNIWHQLVCIVLERRPCDRVVMLLFPLMWVLYVAPFDPYYCWWGLWWLSMIQFFSAAYEGAGPTLAGYWTFLKSFVSAPPRVMRLGLAGNA